MLALANVNRFPMATINTKVLFNVPNLVTFSRIGAIPFIVWLLAIQGPERTVTENQIYSGIAALIFVVAGISDLVDGYYARKYGIVSILGKFMDPTADKLIHMAVMVMLIPLGRFPAWLVVILLFREIMISGLRTVAAAEGIHLSARDWGKKKMVWLTCGLTGLIIYYPIPYLGISAYSFGWVCIGIGLIYSFLSAGEYLYLFFRHGVK